MPHVKFDSMLNQQRMVCLIGRKPILRRALLAKILKMSLIFMAAGGLSAAGLGIFLTSERGQKVSGEFLNEWALLKNSFAPIPDKVAKAEGFAWIVDGEIHQKPYFNRKKYNDGRDHITQKFGKKNVNDILVLNFEDTDAMILFFQQKLNPEQAMTTLSYLHAANGVVVLGRFDRELAEREAARQNDAKKWLDRLWVVLDQPKELHAFFAETSKNNSDTSSLLNTEKLGTLQNHNNQERWGEVQTQAEQPLRVIPDEADLGYFSYDKEYPAPRKAKEELIEAVRESGLAAVRVPIETASSPRATHLLAKMITQANKDLEHVTGWRGGLMGLNYRVVWEMDARWFTATTTSDNGYIYIKSWWEQYAHEWFHALDRSQGNHVKPFGFLPKVNILLSDINSPKYREWSNTGDQFHLTNAQHSLWEGISHPLLTKQDRQQVRSEYIDFTNLLSQKKPNWNDFITEGFLITQDETSNLVVNKGSPWLYFTNRAIDLERTSSFEGRVTNTKQGRYLGDVGEILARGFAGYSHVALAEKIDAEKILLVKRHEEGTLAVLGPTSHESRATQNTWRNFFTSTSSWWINDTQTRKSSTEENVNTSTQALKQKRAP